MKKENRYSYIVEKKQKKYTSNKSMEEKLVNLLIEKELSIATAESITGGLVGSRIVNIPGASKVYEEGYITYSDRIKNKVLNINYEILDKYTAVSVETCAEMLIKLKEKSNAKSIMVTTGFAGPGEMEGLAFIGTNYNNLYNIIKFESKDARNVFRNKVVEIGFNNIYNLINNN